MKSFIEFDLGILEIEVNHETGDVESLLLNGKDWYQHGDVVDFVLSLIGQERFSEATAKAKEYAKDEPGHRPMSPLGRVLFENAKIINREYLKGKI